MKTKIILYILFSISFSSFGQLFMSTEKKALLKEVKQFIKNTVSTASYNKKASEVYNAMYVVATKEYNQIVKESEKRGFIEAKQDADLYKENATFEVRGDEPPYKVSFQVKKETRTKNATSGEYTSWNTATVPDDYITKLQQQVYESLNGAIELPKDLLDKIEKFNSEQTKDNKKVLKGKDY